MSTETTSKVSSPAMMVWQLDRLIGQLILVGDHYSDPSCPCSYGYDDPSGQYVSERCIPKHLLAIFEYATETALMTSDLELRAGLEVIAEDARRIRDLEKRKLCGQYVDQEDIAEWSREKRKLLEPYTYNTTCEIPGYEEDKDDQEPPAPVKPINVCVSCNQEPPAPAKRVRYNRADIQDTMKAALRLLSDRPLYIFATYFGYTIDQRDPGPTQSFYKLSPGPKLEYYENRSAVPQERELYPPAPAKNTIQVCGQIARAKKIHEDYLNLPEDPVTGDHPWHQHWIDVYHDTLDIMNCPAGTEPPAPPQPFGWVGGKKQLAGRIVKMMPAHRTYVEPFCGAAAVFWKKEPSEVEVLNDLDKDLMRFYRNISGINKCDIMDIARDFEDLKARQGSLEPCEFLSVLKCSYGDKRMHYAEPKECLSNASNFHKYLDFYKERLKGVKLHNEDFEPVILRYDATDALFFLDPPYHGTTRDYPNGEDVLQRLQKLLPKLKGNWILTYDNDPDVRKAFKQFNIMDAKSVYTMQRHGNSQVGKKLIITNFKVKKPPVPPQGNGELVAIKWRDAQVFRGVYLHKDIDGLELGEIEQPCYLLTKDEHSVKMALERTSDGQFRDIYIIPACQIVDIKPLEAPAPPPYSFMKLSEIEKYESEMKRLKVSEVARSPRGFLTAFKRAGGDPGKLSESWKQKRNGFIARHLAQYNNNPTYRRQLALIAWAYYPAKKPPAPPVPINICYHCQ